MTKLDIQMFHDDSLKPIYFEVKGQGHESQKNSAGAGLWVIVSSSLALLRIPRF